MKGAEQARLKQIFEAIDHMSEQMTEFDDETVRAVVERYRPNIPRQNHHMAYRRNIV